MTNMTDDSRDQVESRPHDADCVASNDAPTRQQGSRGRETPPRRGNLVVLVRQGGGVTLTDRHGETIGEIKVHRIGTPRRGYPMRMILSLPRTIRITRNEGTNETENQKAHNQ